MEEEARSKLLEFLNVLENSTDIVGLRQLHVLTYLSLQNGGTSDFGEMADAIGMSRPATTRNVQRLAELGLVSSKINKNDRRKVIVTITKAGMSTFEEKRRKREPRVAGEMMASA